MRVVMRAPPPRRRKPSAIRSATSCFACARAASAIASKARRDRRGKPRAHARARRASSSRSGITRPGAAAREMPRVQRLMVVDRRRERHENGADADHRELRDRQRAGARDDEVGPAIGAALMSSMNVVDACIDAGRGVRRTRARRVRGRPGARPRGVLRPGSAASACGTVRFKIRAPWLPPSTSTRRRGLCARAARERSRGSSPESTSGAPDCRSSSARARWRELPGNASKTRAASGASQRFVVPATEFCS